MGGSKAQLWVAFAILVWASAAAQGDSASTVNFDRDIRPILSDNCFHCHGPDEAQRKAGLRLDTRAGAFAKTDTQAVIVSGDPAASPLIQRIESTDPDEQMPPPEAKKKFGEAERALLRQWVAEGAAWSEHWSLVPPEKPALPDVRNAAWPRNPIDNFIAAKLDSLGLAPAPEASRRTLIRRLSLDLTGLPPTPDEVDLFLADNAESAYERLVDRLLASPRYGERMAWPWLDAARYADTNGYQGDRERTMYPWRDWVVQAFNDNMPYDQFTVEQLAGDLLPDATRDQRLATGFLRNHMINGEGGRIAEENRVEYVFDQLETVGTVWMGLTMNCCRCHDHKYDPLTQKDYYQFFAYFNQTPVNGAGGDGQTPPNLAIHSDETVERLASLRAEIETLDGKLTAREAELAPQQADWEKAELARVFANEKNWTFFTVRDAKAEHQSLEVHEDGSVLAIGENPEKERYELAGEVALSEIRAIRLEALRYLERKEGELIPAPTGNFVLTDFEVRVRHPDGTEAPIVFASAEATYEQGGLPVSAAIDEDPESGWAVYEGVPIDRDHEALFRLAAPMSIPPGSTVHVTLKHESKHAQHILRHFRISASAAPDLPLAPARHDIASILRTPPENRDEAAQFRIAVAHRDSDATYRNDRRARQIAQKTIEDIEARAIKVMVMADMEEPRETYVLKTGLYNQRQDVVTADVPEFLFDLPPDAPKNRLSLARWLVDPRHPLTARVTVNRFWAELFGQGLVKSTENFGVQGEAPSHPQLLDWLAVSFVESGWDVKALMRLMVTSATYRQSSDTDSQKLEADAANRYLAHGPRYRMPSWMIRDQALAASGLLAGDMGGPPVKPYQPEGLWQEFSFGKFEYKPGSGDELYRRSLYTYWRRIVGPPMFFDSSSRQTCSVKSPRTNTPTHALATLNDPTYVEAARAMAEGLLLMPGATDADRINQAFQLSMARPASEEETALLLGSMGRLRGQFASAPEAAKAYIAVGDSNAPEGLDRIELAAYSALCLSILNTDEALTKE